MRFSLSTILDLVSVVAGVAPPLVAAIQAAKILIFDPAVPTVDLTADVAIEHVNAAEAKRAEVSDATVGRIEGRPRPLAEPPIGEE